MYGVYTLQRLQRSFQRKCGWKPYISLQEYMRDFTTKTLFPGNFVSGLQVQLVRYEKKNVMSAYRIP